MRETVKKRKGCAPLSARVSVSAVVIVIMKDERALFLHPPTLLAFTPKASSTPLHNHSKDSRRSYSDSNCVHRMMRRFF